MSREIWDEWEEWEIWVIFSTNPFLLFFP